MSLVKIKKLNEFCEYLKKLDYFVDLFGSTTPSNSNISKILRGVYDNFDFCVERKDIQTTETYDVSIQGIYDSKDEFINEFNEQYDMVLDIIKQKHNIIEVKEFSYFNYRDNETFEFTLLVEESNKSYESRKLFSESIIRLLKIKNKLLEEYETFINVIYDSDKEKNELEKQISKLQNKLNKLTGK